MSKHRTRRTIWNRLLSGVLCLALALGLLPAAGLVQTAEAASWADPYGQQLVEWGIMQSASDLRLGATITRAEFVAMCNRAFGYHRLGSTPFIDVPASAWYAQDINIAYNAGYFQGTATNMASPNGTLTREQAAVLLVRNMMLQEVVGESLSFTDSRDFSDWSRGLVAAAAQEGVISGNDDGSFKPFNNITRGEVAAMLVRAVGNPISAAGSYAMGDVYGNVTISSPNVTLRNTTILGNLYITGGVDLGNVLLENVTVLGRIVICGGGESNAGQSSVILRNVAADELVVDSILNQFTTVSAYGITDIPVTHVRSDLYLEDASWPGYGLKYIELDGDPGTELQLAGAIKEVVNKTPFSTLRLVQGTAEKITIDEYAVDSELILDINTRVDELNLDVATLVRGKGDITHLIIGAAGSVVEILPEKVTIRPGITATIDGEEIDSNGAAELSSEPRLLASYPKVANLTPTQVEAQFSANKQGTIYYAVSELADGSVSEEDLITNPAYGGNIYEGQAGSIDADSKTVYSRDITRLVPDGSYYLSAIMEDGRGLRSPLKVISFTTPDDTVPEFLNGRISRETCDVVQLTGMANKSCILYWVLLEDGAAAPTPQNFKSGSFGGNYGSGSLNVTKNVPVSITVNTMRLLEDTKYVLYVWLNDFNGAQSSQVYRFDVHTPDETPPVVTNIMQTGYGESDAEVTFTINEVPSTLYWAVVTESNESFITPDADMDDLRIQIKVENGTKAGADISGSTPANGANVDTLITAAVLRGLDYATYKTHSFKLYYVAKDAAGNYSKVDYIIIHTLDTDPPHAWLEFSDAVNGNPQANSDIRIVFDEQVKGGQNATQTFLDYYNDVATFAKLAESDSSYESSLTAAKNTLAEQLAAHIELWYNPGNSSPIQQIPRGDTPAFGSGDDDNWVIDFHNAIITMEKGNMVITLPGSGDNRALNLDSGATYYFQLKGVYDDAFTPNGVAVDEDKGIMCVPEGGVKSDDGNGRLAFTTLYAQVELYENTSVISIDEDNPDNDDPGYRLDIVMDVKPKSTSKVPTTEYWDLIMWSNVIMKADIYCQVVELDENTGREISAGPWERVREGVEFMSADEGRGLGERYSLTDFQTVQSGLLENHIYRYGIHIAEINRVREEKCTEEPRSWSDRVVMHFSLIAGTVRNVQSVSQSVNARYDRFVQSTNPSESVHEIGVVYTSAEPESILECSKPFNDLNAPSFQSVFPTFEAGSGSITMQVGLDRPGTVYYVVAPAGTNDVITQIDAGTPITAGQNGNNSNGNDGDGQEEYKDGKFDSDKSGKDDYVEALKAHTYIPVSGSDRENYAYKIYFKNTDKDLDKDADPDDFTPGQYGSPDYLDIYNGASTYRNKPRVVSGSVEVESSSGSEEVTISNLEPKTEYYVYIVLKGGGDPSPIVEIYRVYTTELKPPAIEINASGASSINMRVCDVNGDGTLSDNLYANSRLYYALWERNKLPSIFRDVYTWPEKGSRTITDGDKSTKAAEVADAGNTLEMSVLKAMMTPIGTSGQTYFDKCATTSMKNSVVQYIDGRMTPAGNEPAGRFYTNGGTDENPKGQNFDDKDNAYMTSDVSEYVALACAKSSKGVDTGDAYGFAAVRGLYKPDTEPPAFAGNAINKDGYLTSSITVDQVNGKDVTDAEWQANPGKYTYSGEVEIVFSKEIYCSYKQTLYTLESGAGEMSAATGKAGIRTVIGGTGKTKITSGTVNGRSVTLTFKGLKAYDTITFFGTGNIANSGNYATDKTLYLTFFPVMFAGETMKSTQMPTLVTPGFQVSWQ